MPLFPPYAFMPCYRVFQKLKLNGTAPRYGYVRGRRYTSTDSEPRYQLVFTPVETARLDQLDIKTDPDIQAGRKFSAPSRNPTANHRTSFCAPTRLCGLGKKKFTLYQGSLGGIKRLGRESNNSLVSNVEIRN
jgi:hypothetical protein